MIKKNVLKKIGVFAMTVMLAAAPVMAVGAANATALVSGSGTGTDIDTGSEDPVVTPDPTDPTVTPAPIVTPDPTPTVKPGATGNNSVDRPTDSGSQESDDSDDSEAEDNYVVTTAGGTTLVSTVPGVYAVSCVPGVAFTTPKNQLPGDLTVEVRNSARGDKAAQSINDGLAILAANGVNAVKGPEIDITAYIKSERTIDLDRKITVAFGIPSDFKQAGYDYAVMLIQEGGRVSILPDTKADSACITINTSGTGVYVLVKAPAGSFDKFR